jgi:hypothetical protein
MACCTFTGALDFTDVVVVFAAGAEGALVATGERAVALQVTGFFG